MTLLVVNSLAALVFTQYPGCVSSHAELLQKAMPLGATASRTPRLRLCQQHKSDLR